MARKIRVTKRDGVVDIEATWKPNIYIDFDTRDDAYNTKTAVIIRIGDGFEYRFDSRGKQMFPDE